MIESLGMEQFLFQLINETTHLVTEAFRRCQVLRWNLAIASAAKTARWKRAITLLQGLHMQHLQPDTHLDTLGQWFLLRLRDIICCWWWCCWRVGVQPGAVLFGRCSVWASLVFLDYWSKPLLSYSYRLLWWFIIPNCYIFESRRWEKSTQPSWGGCILTWPMAKRLKLFGITYLVGKISRSNLFRVHWLSEYCLWFHLISCRFTPVFLDKPLIIESWLSKLPFSQDIPRPEIWLIRPSNRVSKGVVLLEM